MASQQTPVMPPPATYHVPFDRYLQDYVQTIMDHFHVPGMSMAVVHHGQTRAKGFGLASVADGVGATPDTLYYAGSTTKSFTAAGLQMMIAESQNTTQPLSWQTPVSSLIREDFVLQDEYMTERATLEDLASHRTGLPGHDCSAGGFDVSLREVVRSLRHLPFSAEPRTTFQYSNLMFIALSYVVETLTGTLLGDFLRERIWKPLGMNATYLSLQDARNSSSYLSIGYRWDHISARHITVDHIDAPQRAGAGNIISSVVDYARYLEAIISAASPLSQEWFTEMSRPRTFMGGRSDLSGPAWYSLGWTGQVYRGIEIFSHNGGKPGFGAEMAFIPALKWGFVSFGNADWRSNLAGQTIMYKLVDDLLKVPQDQRFDWKGEADSRLESRSADLQNSRERLFPTSPESPTVRPQLPFNLYLGTYSHPAYGNLSIEIGRPSSELPLQERTKRDGKILRARITFETESFGMYLEHVNADHFLAWLVAGDAPDGPPAKAFRAEFRIDASGQSGQVGIELEPLLRNNEKIWFQRVAGDDQAPVEDRPT